jgi:hypothetical protein
VTSNVLQIRARRTWNAAPAGESHSRCCGTANPQQATANPQDERADARTMSRGAAAVVRGLRRRRAVVTSDRIPEPACGRGAGARAPVTFAERKLPHRAVQLRRDRWSGRAIRVAQAIRARAKNLRVPTGDLVLSGSMGASSPSVWLRGADREVGGLSPHLDRQPGGACHQDSPRRRWTTRPLRPCRTGDRAVLCATCAAKVAVTSQEVSVGDPTTRGPTTRAV